jgi:hypothetical protein
MRATGTGQLAHLLLDVVDLLTQFGIPYAVVGALAVSFHDRLPRFNGLDPFGHIKGAHLWRL